MPFTLSHPAAILPLLRHPFVPAALIAGAIAPDLPYFQRLPVSAESWYEPFVNATYSHSFQGMLLVGLPSVALLLGIYYLIRGPIVDLLPCELVTSTRRRSARGTTWNLLGWGLISALIGLFSHVLWDSLTHGGGWLSSLGFLQGTVLAGIPSSRWPQHVSSVLGLAFLALWIFRRFKTGAWRLRKLIYSPTQTLQRITITALILASAMILSLVNLLKIMSVNEVLGIEYLVIQLITHTGMYLATCVLLYALLWHAKRILK